MTDPELELWPATSGGGHRRSEVSRRVGTGTAVWVSAGEALMRWGVKTRSGFSVEPPAAVEVGDRPIITVRLPGFRIYEPVEVTAVVRTPDRVGFAYRTLPGHPVSGEEAFILHRAGEEVWLTVRSLTRSAPQLPWRALYPLLRLAQIVARRRYLRALP